MLVIACKDSSVCTGVPLKAHKMAVWVVNAVSVNRFLFLLSFRKLSIDQKIKMTAQGFSLEEVLKQLSDAECVTGGASGLGSWWAQRAERCF